MKALYIFFFFLFFAASCNAQSTTISGYLRESGSREALIGASVFCKENQKIAVTNNYGYFQLSVPLADTVSISISCVGFKIRTIRILVNKNTPLDIDLETQNAEIQEVVVKAERRLENSPLSIMKLDVKKVKEIPALLGEKDVLKVIQLLPGVQSSNEGGSGISVRGGGADQNLIILDDMPIYNVSHLFGFFSIFNGDAVKDINFLKGNFPAKYGGRLSSVIEVTMKEGNKEKLHGEGGIGIISSRMTLEGPIRKGKSSFLVSGRSMYQQLLATPFFKLSGYRNPVFNFYDFNAKANFQLSEKDNLYISSYFGRDAYGTAGVINEGQEAKGRETINWANRTASMRWNHLFSPRLFSNFVVGTTNYRFESQKNSKENGATQYDLSSGSSITDAVVKADFTYLINEKNNFKTGFIAQQHFFRPTDITYSTDSSFSINGFSGKIAEQKKYLGTESAFYAENTFKPNEKIALSLGARYSMYAAKTKNYAALEPRINLGFALSKKLSISASATQMNQYVHLVSNSGIALPTDLWIPSTDKIKPQTGKQLSLGASYVLDKQGLILSVEGFYKKMDNIVGYREGANFLQIDITSTNPQVVDWENLITQGKGTAYGVEFFLQKNQGKLTGWAAYTYGKVSNQFAELNFGRAFAPRQDRRHTLNLVGIYQWNKKVKLSGTWTFSTGNPVQIPLAITNVKPHLGTVNQQVIEYGARDSYRNPAYHRLDLAIQLHKQKRRYARYWEFGIFNVYNRLNPLSYSIGNRETTGGGSKFVLEKTSLFTFVPSVSYNFKF